MIMIMIMFMIMIMIMIIIIIITIFIFLLLIFVVVVQLCGSTNTSSSTGVSLVGREVNDNVTCHECCGGNLCNWHLCSTTLCKLIFCSSWVHTTVVVEECSSWVMYKQQFVKKNIDISENYTWINALFIHVLLYLDRCTLFLLTFHRLARPSDVFFPGFRYI